MPREALMSWDARHRRWHKMYRRVRYVVSCSQLGSPQTKEGSYRAANAWWARKKAEVDGTAPEPDWEALLDPGEDGPSRRTPELRDKVIAWALHNGDVFTWAAVQGKLR